MGNFKGKTVVITGGSRGIGRACCLAFTQEKANVVFTYHKSTKEANFLKKEVKALGGTCLDIQMDVRDYQQCQEVVKKTVKKFKRPDILVNNAGITKDRALVMMTLDDWKEVVDTNLGGVFNMSRAFITTFLKRFLKKNQLS